MIINDYWWNAIWSIIPTIAIAATFWFVLRSILRADRTERKAYARVEREMRLERRRGEGLSPPPESE